LTGHHGLVERDISERRAKLGEATARMPSEFPDTHGGDWQLRTMLLEKDEEPFEFRHRLSADDDFEDGGTKGSRRVNKAPKFA
jgi:hypothetical protein